MASYDSSSVSQPVGVWAATSPERRAGDRAQNYKSHTVVHETVRVDQVHSGGGEISVFLSFGRKMQTRYTSQDCVAGIFILISPILSCIQHSVTTSSRWFAR